MTRQPGDIHLARNKETPSDDALLRIREAVAAVTGAHIERDAAARLHAALRAGASSIEATVLLADLRGFTAISESCPPHTVLEVLNRYLARMCEIAVRNGGTIDKFMGDAIMVLFGVPQGAEDDARRAVTCAVQMQIAMSAFNQENEARGLPPLYMGAGINTGRVMAGMLGSELHSEYTVVGDEVNAASRIESFSLRGQVLVSKATLKRCAEFVRAGPPMDVHVKGKSRRLRIHQVLAIPSLGLEVPRKDQRASPRVAVKIPFSYQMLEGKIVAPRRHAGVVVDLGYQGMLVEVEAGLPRDADVVFGFDLSPVGGRAREVYGKVRYTKPDGGRSLAAIEFTSISRQAEQDIRHFIQVLMQGSEAK